MQTDTTQHDVRVRFDPSTRSVTFEPSSEISIHTASGLVVYSLMAPARIFFPSNPIQWVDDALQPIDTPHGVMVQRSNLSTSILITTADAPPKLSFYVIVQTQGGRFFGTDPTIVTMRPGSEMED